MQVPGTTGDGQQDAPTADRTGYQGRLYIVIHYQDLAKGYAMGLQDGRMNIYAMECINIQCTARLVKSFERNSVRKPASPTTAGQAEAPKSRSAVPAPHGDANRPDFILFR